MRVLAWFTLVGLSGCMATENPEAQMEEAQRLIRGLQSHAPCAPRIADAQAALDYAHFEQSAPDGRRFAASSAATALYKARQAVAACEGTLVP